MADLVPVFTVRRAYDEERRAYPAIKEWVVVYASSDSVVCFDGQPIYGGNTPAQALIDARAIAQNFNGEVRDPIDG